jgi:hypothetical protein
MSIVYLIRAQHPALHSAVTAVSIKRLREKLSREQTIWIHVRLAIVP